MIELLRDSRILLGFILLSFSFSILANDLTDAQCDPDNLPIIIDTHFPRLIMNIRDKDSQKEIVESCEPESCGFHIVMSLSPSNSLKKDGVGLIEVIKFIREGEVILVGESYRTVKLPSWNSSPAVQHLEPAVYQVTAIDNQKMMKAILAGSQTGLYLAMSQLEVQATYTIESTQCKPYHYLSTLHPYHVPLLDHD